MTEYILDTYNFTRGKCKRREIKTYVSDVIYWIYEYKYLKISIYLDQNDDLGLVGEPYYEMYDVSDSLSQNNFDDTIRFLEVESYSLIKELEKQALIHDKEIEMYPERFI